MAAAANFTTEPTMIPSPLPLIAILRGITPDEVRAHVRVLIDAGISQIEIPTNSPDWLGSVQLALQEADGHAEVGAGTVLDIADVDRLADTGARLMVTPNTNPVVIAHARSRGLDIAAGFATASEAFAAVAAGAQRLKLFPASQFGPGYVRALKAVLPGDVPLYAVGGIGPGNLAEYLQAGCAGAGLGGELYHAGQDAATTAQHADAFVAALRKVNA
jgi:2-dehydro-3-deoxyphosphogalactonate aldolase